MWQYYVASYTMSEATEGVDQASMHFPYLRRNVAPQNANPDTTLTEVYGNLQHFDNQTAFIAPDTYKLLLSSDFIFERTKVQPRKKYDDSDPVQDRKMEENEAFRQKFVANTAWMKDQPSDLVAQRKGAWESALREGLETYEERLA